MTREPTSMLTPDRNDRRPETSATAISALWDALRITHVPSTGAATTRLLSALRATHVNGGAEFASFNIDATPTFRWFISRDQWAEIEFPEHFLQAPAVAAALPNPCKGPIADSFGFEPASPFTLAGELAQTMASGGAYRRHEAGAAHAATLADEFRQELFGARFDEVLAMKSFKPWSDWFFDVAWDATWLVIDKRRSTVSVLTVTDTD